ncbi:MAG: squalene/phytoene synthase family protein [Anaerolineae bacterium]|nr:squalene/phytoene synthase family protein [Anaerolineae bacterium]
MDLEQLLRASSRTFAPGIEGLPGKLGWAMTVAYLLLRVSDYLEDNREMPGQQKVELLCLWDQVLAGEVALSLWTEQVSFPDEMTPDALVAQHAVRVVDALQQLPTEVYVPIVKHVRDSTQGMARWVARGPLVLTEADLDDYMHEVAGRVGYLVTDLFAWYSHSIRRRMGRLMPLARECGLALQTVNVVRGLRDDYERGWIFVPESFCARAGIAREALFDPACQQQAMQVVDMLADKAERHLQAAMTYFKMMPPWQHGIRLSCLFPLLLARRTLAVSRRSCRVLESKAKVGRDEVVQIMRDSTMWGWSNWWVERYARRLAVAPAG